MTYLFAPSTTAQGHLPDQLMNAHIPTFVNDSVVLHKFNDMLTNLSLTPADPRLPDVQPVD